MNFRFWDVRFGAGPLIAIVSILHVFVSHFAVGGLSQSSIHLTRLRFLHVHC
jgi:hypothetical protein